MLWQTTFLLPCYLPFVIILLIVDIWQMANAIANKKSICNAVYVCLTVCYDCILQMANKMLKLCVQKLFYHLLSFKLLLFSSLTKSKPIRN